jgi:hypothetical protein
MTLQERITNLENNYIPHKTYHLNTSERISLGDKDKKRCRFCNKTTPEVQFNSVAHAIPEFVNNHNLISYYECDSCNSKFARTLETHMGDYMNPFHTMSQVKGKKGVPSYSKGGEKSRIDLKDGAIRIESHDGERNIFEINEEKKTITIKSIRATYIPIAIYKCLTKMALTIMNEDELINFKSTLEWINEEQHVNSRFSINNLKCIFSFTPGPLPHDFTTCTLFRRKEVHKDNVPYMIFLLAYGNYTFQIYLPMSDKDSGDAMVVPIPTPFDIKNEYGTPKYKILDFASKEKVKNEEVRLQMSFSNFDETIIDIKA